MAGSMTGGGLPTYTGWIHTELRENSRNTIGKRAVFIASKYDYLVPRQDCTCCIKLQPLTALNPSFYTSSHSLTHLENV